MPGTPGVVSNMAAKGGVLGMTRQIGVDFVSKGVRVNAILPGGTRTPALITAMADREKDLGLEAGSMVERIGESHPKGRIAEPEDVAKVALFFASDDSEWVTGQFINVSGAM
jgi:NAD(P)-dependent dehydrogenase (short-subunit alcohol dehydrogenase family)